MNIDAFKPPLVKKGSKYTPVNPTKEAANPDSPAGAGAFLETRHVSGFLG
jgi:hypothetical protein